MNNHTKAEQCLVCHGDITMTMCQQSQEIDGTSYPLHVGCFDVWANEEIEVFTVRTEDYAYTTNYSSVLAEMHEMSYGDEVTVKKWKMPRLKYLMMPEADI